MPTAPATSSPGAARFSLRAAHGGAAKTTLEIPWTSRTACRGFIRVAARNEATSEVYDRSVNDRKNPSLRRAADFLSVFFADRRRELHAAAHRVPRRRGRARRGRGKPPYRIVPRRIVCCRRARASDVCAVVDSFFSTVLFCTLAKLTKSEPFDDLNLPSSAAPGAKRFFVFSSRSPRRVASSASDGATRTLVGASHRDPRTQRTHAVGVPTRGVARACLFRGPRVSRAPRTATRIATRGV